MKLKVTVIGNSSGLIIPKPAMDLFQINRGDLYQAEFTKNKIILNKLKSEKAKKPKTRLTDKEIEKIVGEVRKEKELKKEAKESVVLRKCDFCEEYSDEVYNVYNELLGIRGACCKSCKEKYA